MTTVTVIFPEKGDLPVKMKVDPEDTTLADIAESLEEKFECGSDMTCYFMKVDAKVGEYLDNNKTLDELGLKGGGYKLLGYIKSRSLPQGRPQPNISTFMIFY